MKQFLTFLFLVFSVCAYGQLYPLADTSTVRKGLEGIKDIRIRFVKNGNDPLRDVSLKTLFGELDKKLSGGADQILSRPLQGTLKLTTSGASNYVTLPDSSATNELQTLSAGTNTITLSQGGGTVTVDTTPNDGTVTSVGISVPTGLSVTGSPITTNGTFTFGLTNDLAALEGLASTGIAVRTAADTWVQRTINGTASQITVTNGNGVSGNPVISLTNTGVSVGTYGSTTTVGTFTVDAQGRITSASNVPITIVDGSITNEGSLTVGAGAANSSTIISNTSGSTPVTIVAGSAMSISETGNTITLTNAVPDQTVVLNQSGIVSVSGTYPTFTIGATEVDGSTTNEIQTLSRPTTGTLKLTTNGASNFVTLPDSSQTNEGSLTVGAGTGTTSIINSNTSGSTGVTLTAGTGMGISEVGNVITLNATNTGTVTSVAMTVPTGLSVSGSPITGAGTFALTLADDLAGLEALGGTGYVVRTGSNTYATRTITTPLGTLSLTHGNGVSSGTTIDLPMTGVTNGSYGTTLLIPTISVDSYGRITSASNNFLPSQIASKPYGNTLKLTNYYGLSTFLTCSPDSTIENEGKLTLSSGGANTTLINSNTAFSTPVTLIASGGITSSIMGNTVTLTGGTGLKHIKHSTANIGRGLLTTINITKDTATVELRYSAFKNELFIDTSDLVMFYDSSAQTNSRQPKKSFNYNAFQDVTQSTVTTQALTANTNADLKLATEGLGLVFDYNPATGEIVYNGTIPKMFVIQGRVQYKFSVLNSNQELELMLKPSGGAYAEIATEKGNNTSTMQSYGFSVMRIYNLSQGDRLKLQIRSDATGTWTTNTGYFHIFALSDNYNPN